MENILKCTKEIKKFLLTSIKAYKEGKSYHYVYTHSNNGIVFYIGKGSHDRAVKVTGRGKNWYEFAFNKDIEVNIITQLLSNSEALKIENSLINKYKNTCVNKTFSKSELILCFDRLGNFIKQYSCINAVQFDKFQQSCVTQCCNKERGLHKNKVWMYQKDYQKNGFSYKKANNHSKIIIQKTLKNEIIRELLTADAFIEFGFSPKNIQQVCKGHKKSHKNFIFVYK